MTQQIIEFEHQKKSQVMESTMPNGAKRYRVTQPALLFTPGEKYPDKFDYYLYNGDDINTANSVQPNPVGRYNFKPNAIGVRSSFGIMELNLDASEIEPVQSNKAN
ncbi:hypothetical protein [uncultured Methylophaga sp.]|uniref:hypothetical protein n=1 Tax=uncultured Methylophaga sp. TaxID=285271 RepID=UPI00262F776D|nr:hypothetical protein [uncultured Methylophaga sp.]